MGELLFVGLGLGDERDLTQRAREALAGCGRLFAEEYTAALAPGSIERLSASLGRPIERLAREEVEGERTVLGALEGETRVAFLVVGDPFAATTHLALRLAVERAGHRWRYFPNASILTAAAGFLGLILYRFGRTVSLPLPEAGFAPTSPLERVEENRAAGLHSLLLLDLRPTEGRYLLAHDALRLLEERERARGGSTFVPGLELAVVARVGTDSAQGWWGRLGRLARVEFGPPMHAIVVPAPSLHFEEEEALRRYAVA